MSTDITVYCQYAFYYLLWSPEIFSESVCVCERIRERKHKERRKGGTGRERLSCSNGTRNKWYKQQNNTGILVIILTLNSTEKFIRDWNCSLDPAECANELSQYHYVPAVQICFHHC